MLDTALLAQVAEPQLGGYTLEHLASWLGVAVEGRHSALGDAVLTGRIFIALLPKLRAGNIRTLAEAEKACLALTGVLEGQHRAGWVEPVAPAAARTEALARIDVYPYRHRVADVMSAPAARFRADDAARRGADRLAQEKISSLLVAPAAEGAPFSPAGTGIITERDVLRALRSTAPAALARPAGGFASRPLVTVPAAAFVYRALGRMSRLKLRHLGVEDEIGEVCGIVTSRDLLRLRAQEAAVLGDGLDEADDVPRSAPPGRRLPQAAAGLMAEGVGGRDIAAVISRELGALTRRAGVLAERRMLDEGQGAPPCAYALCVLGSAGRGESLLAMDQDNAIVFAEGEPGGAADRWFAHSARIVADILHEVGVPYCTGGIMARNDAWRGSMATWRARVAGLDRAVPIRPICCRSTSSSILSGCTATPRWPRVVARRLRRGAGQCRLRQAAGAIGRRDAARAHHVRQHAHRERPHRSQEGRPVRHRHARARAGDPPSRARARDAGAARRRGRGRSWRQQADLAALRARRATSSISSWRSNWSTSAGLPPSNKVAVNGWPRAARPACANHLRAVRHLDTLMRDLLF